MPAKQGFDLQSSDIDLITYVFQLRMATIGHLQLLTGRSEIALWRRLRKLRERRYLTSVGRILQKHVYAIGSAAKPVLIEQGYAEEDLLDKRLRHNEATEIGIRHSLFVADIHARLMMLTKNGPVRITLWREGPGLWDTVRLPGKGIVPVRPDAYFVLHDTTRPRGKNQCHVFLEADRSTMNHNRMAEKISAYLAYYDQGRHAKKYPAMQAFTVATITETRSRANELRADLHGLIPRAAMQRAYPFIAFENLSLKTLLPRAVSD